MSESHRNLIVWQKAMDLVTVVYRDTSAFPSSEIHGLTSQLRRAAAAVPSDIAEGKGRLSKREYVQFLSKARGSLYEVETQLEISRNLGYLTQDHFESLVDSCSEIGRMLNGLIRAVRGQLAASLRDYAPAT